MIVGFNHNISYRGVGFHVQTEDSGPKKPQLVTLLYHEGTIIASQKTLYADILKVENLDQVVEDLAKEQHKGMLRRLTRGEFDQRIIDFGIPLSPPGEKTVPPPSSAASDTLGDQDDAPDAPAEEPAAQVADMMTEAADDPLQDIDFRNKPPSEWTLDDLIHAYLSAAEL